MFILLVTFLVLEAARFFGGWSYRDDMCGDDAFAQRGYDGGVPMGGDLPPTPATASDPGAASTFAPTFAVSALRDAGTPEHPGAPLQRVQIVKIWLEDGAANERIYEVQGEPREEFDPDTGKFAFRVCQLHYRPFMRS